MSANRWSVCPKCKRIKEKEKRAKIQKIAESYGKVSASDYQKMLTDLSREKDLRPEQTLREYYQLWIDENGKVHISYYASCDKCKLDYEHRHEEQLKID
jgi:hypothetical protein